MYSPPGRLRSMSRCLIFKPRPSRLPPTIGRDRNRPLRVVRGCWIRGLRWLVSWDVRGSWRHCWLGARMTRLGGCGWSLARAGSGKPRLAGCQLLTGARKRSQTQADLVRRRRVWYPWQSGPPDADGEILVRTVYASICGSDLHEVFFETPPPSMPPGHPGHESVGEVAESRCPGFAPGDCVLTVPHAADGRCLSEFQALPGSACVRLPAMAELSHLLMAQQLGTVVYALRRHPLDLVGRDVAVIGQGSAGAFFTFLLKRAGVARVLVSDKSPARLAYGRRLGA